MNENYNKSPYEHIRANLYVYALAGLIMALGTSLSNLFDDDLLSFVGTIINLIVQYAVVWFFYNAIHKDVPDLADMWTLFKQPGLFVKVLPLILVEFLITEALNIVSGLLAFIPLVGWIASIIVSMLAILFMPVRYMFAANSAYDTATYFKVAVRYMNGNILRYFGVVLFYIFMFVIAIVLATIVPIIGWILLIPIMILGVVMMEIAVAQFMATIIPPQWYDGTEVC